ncbi:DUF982 domain-containing protein [Mesorhizobium sp.]|uniref:DUF982 domain-containing protein n=1 Tax=Mesorhizobium sp. TaxID=1871066 RepID=UPI0025B829A4|nr:DUF982 domain-containing protein [Mesorhizobium sp.]
MIATLSDRIPAVMASAPSYGTAVKACGAARSGEISAESARDALVNFAVTVGILWPADQPTVSVKPVSGAA